MFGRGKFVTSLLRAAALVAGAVILAPFCTFADSAPAPAAITFTVTPGPTPLLIEGGAPGVFDLTVENISPVPIVVRSLTVTRWLGFLGHSRRRARRNQERLWLTSRPAKGPRGRR
jgi:hypothetical protein